MTTKEKLESYRLLSGRNWGNIAKILGISRQMMDMVRKGERKFSAPIEQKLDDVLEKITTSSYKNYNPLKSHASQICEPRVNYLDSLGPDLTRSSVMQYAEAGLHAWQDAGKVGQFETLMLHVSHVTDPAQGAWHTSQAKAILDSAVTKPHTETKRSDT